MQDRLQGILAGMRRSGHNQLVSSVAYYEKRVTKCMLSQTTRHTSLPRGFLIDAGDLMILI